MPSGRLHVAKKRRTKAKTIPFCPTKTRQARRDISLSKSEPDLRKSTSNLALTSTNKQIQTPIPDPNTKPNLSNLPNELLQLVFTHLSPCSAACLGLTCGRLYRFFKQQYPHPISLDKGVCQERNPWSKCCCQNCYPWTITLGDLLEHCFLFGPRYRLTDVYLGVVWRFLNIREYGNGITRKDGEGQPINGLHFENNINLKKKEDQLALRYDDYFNAKVEAATLSLLPNPFNKGDAWEREATALILEDRKSFVLLKKWRAFWRGSWVFQRNEVVLEKAVDETLWEEWSEGIKLMGF